MQPKFNDAQKIGDDDFDFLLVPHWIARIAIKQGHRIQNLITQNYI